MSVLNNGSICKSTYFGEDFSAALISISLANIVMLQISNKYYFYYHFAICFQLLKDTEQ